MNGMGWACYWVKDWVRMELHQDALFKNMLGWDWVKIGLGQYGLGTR